MFQKLDLFLPLGEWEMPALVDPLEKAIFTWGWNQI
jgi:hypothetical protein